MNYWSELNEEIKKEMREQEITTYSDRKLISKLIQEANDLSFFNNVTLLLMKLQDHYRMLECIPDR